MKSHNRKLQVYNLPSPSTTSPSMSAVHNLPSSPSPPPPSGEPTFTQSAPPPLPPITAFDSFIALTVLVLLTALFFMGFFSIYIRRFSDDPTPINNSRYHRRRLQDPPNIYRFNSVRKGLDPEIVSSLPLFYYHDDAEYEIDCAICLGELKEQEVVKMIPYCKHVFHVECIDTWLSMHPTCPVCRGTHFFVADCCGGSTGGGCFLSVVNLVAEETADHGGSEFDGGSAVRNANTCDDVTREGASMGLRRSISCTVLTDRSSLQRSWSF